MAMECSVESYRQIIQKALDKGFDFVGFDAFLRDHAEKTPVLFLRHDVDYSVVLAAQLAAVNRDLGVAGTFFVQLRSPVYNLFSQTNLQALEEIVRNGQRLALHLTCPEGDLSAAELYQFTLRDVLTCESQTGFAFERIVAWHNPQAEHIEKDLRALGEELWSAYSPPFFRKGHYFSDSNLRNKPGDLLRIFDDSKHSSIQLLLHPLYWVLAGRSIEDALAKTMVEVVKEREEEFKHNPYWADLEPGALMDFLSSGNGRRGDGS